MTDLDVVGGVTTVRFDNPPVNALDLDVLDTIVATMRRIDGPVVIPALASVSRPVSICEPSSMADPTTRTDS